MSIMQDITADHDARMEEIRGIEVIAMRILEAARRLSMTTRTIRYYEEGGLIELNKQADNGYREVTEQDLSVLQVIGMLRELGLSIEMSAQAS